MTKDATHRSGLSPSDRSPSELDWMRRHWHWVGLVGGVILGLSDYGVFLFMGSPELAPPNPLAFAAALAVVFGALGFAVGKLALARQRARRDADVIQQQLEALEDAQRKLVEQEKLAAVGRLAAGVAHEVRNPLGVIRASASMVQESFAPSDEPYRACEFICQESDRLNALIVSLLSFSRPTQPKLQTIAPDALVDRALRLADDHLAARQVRVGREIDEALLELHADPDLLAQVLLDLLVNAAEAVDERGAVAVRIFGEDEQVKLEVADDGPGIGADERESIFEPFVTSKVRGTGLGLAMARRIAEAHDGTLEAVGQRGLGPEGRGACLRVSLPQTGRNGA